jgi:hypothetical protein
MKYKCDSHANLRVRYVVSDVVGPFEYLETAHLLRYANSFSDFYDHLNCRLVEKEPMECEFCRWQ